MNLYHFRDATQLKYQKLAPYRTVVLNRTQQPCQYRLLTGSGYQTTPPEQHKSDCCCYQEVETKQYHSSLDNGIKYLELIPASAQVPYCINDSLGQYVLMTGRNIFLKLRNYLLSRSEERRVGKEFSC